MSAINKRKYLGGEPRSNRLDSSQWANTSLIQLISYKSTVVCCFYIDLHRYGYLNAMLTSFVPLSPDRQNTLQFLKR
jgi:hypothetical protein